MKKCFVRTLNDWLGMSYVSSGAGQRAPGEAMTTILSSSSAEIAEIDEAEDMVSLRKERTGVAHTVFVSTKGYARHAPRIRIAIDPPDSLNAAAETASMAIHDYSIAGAHMPPQLFEQAKRFIERNRAALLDYWDNKIDTAELIERLRQIDDR